MARTTHYWVINVTGHQYHASDETAHDVPTVSLKMLTEAWEMTA